MELKELDFQIKSGNIKSAYFFYGEETFLLENKVKSIIKKLGGAESGNMNFSKFDGEKSNFEEFSDEFNSYPMGAERKVILLKNTGWLSNGKSKEYKMLKELLEDIPSYICLIIQEDCFDKKKLKNAEIIAEKGGGVLNFEKLGINSLVTWLEKLFEASGKRISTSDINYIINCCSCSMGRIYKEAEKLMLYAADEDKISSTAVRELVIKSNEYKIYELFDDIVEARRESAVRKTRQLLLAKEKPTAVISGITGRLSELLTVKLLSSDRLPLKEISSYLDYPRPDFAVRKMINQSKKYGEKYLKRMIKRGLELDYSIKSGKISGNAAAEVYVTELVK